MGEGVVEVADVDGPVAVAGGGAQAAGDAVGFGWWVDIDDLHHRVAGLEAAHGAAAGHGDGGFVGQAQHVVIERHHGLGVAGEDADVDGVFQCGLPVQCDQCSGGVLEHDFGGARHNFHDGFQIFFVQREAQAMRDAV